MRMKQGAAGPGAALIEDPPVETIQHSEGPTVLVHLWRSDRTMTVACGPEWSVMDLVRFVGLHPDGTIVMQGRRPVPLDERIGKLTELTVIDVQSGG